MIELGHQNSGDILGLPPKHLFSLDDFGKVLDEDNLEILEEALEAMDDRSDEEALNQQGPHTFQITLASIPGWNSDDPLHVTTVDCWCVCWRPNKETRPNLIILEFELVDDTRHPLVTEEQDQVRTGLSG
jgi:hypothetical protein